MGSRPDYCPCLEETPDPCPACGATVDGNDPVHGVCQARYGYRGPPDLEFVLVEKSTGEVVAAQRIL